MPPQDSFKSSLKIALINMPLNQQPQPQRHENQTLGFMGICCSGVCAIILFNLNVMMVALGVDNIGLCEDKNSNIPEYMIGETKS